MEAVSWRWGGGWGVTKWEWSTQHRGQRRKRGAGETSPDGGIARHVCLWTAAAADMSSEGNTKGIYWNREFLEISKLSKKINHIKTWAKMSTEIPNGHRDRPLTCMFSAAQRNVLMKRLLLIRHVLLYLLTLKWKMLLKPAVMYQFAQAPVAWVTKWSW